MRTTAGLCLVAAAMGLAGCSAKPGNGALRVVVGFGSKSKAQCVKVSATTASGTVKLSEGIARAEKSQLTIGIEKGGDLTGNITVEALGYIDTACADAKLNEHSDAQTKDIDTSGVQTVNLTLDGPAAADDNDGDGYSKNVDCDDDAGTVHPGQKETFCANGIDDNCENGIDCADPDCAGQTCDDHIICTLGDVCTGTQCVGVPPNCTSPGFCEQAGGASCGADAGCIYQAATGQSCGDAGLCRSDKTCAPANTEVLCADGVDNDHDGLTDCADPDCNAQSCDGGTSACVNDFTCNAGACSGVLVTCTAPSGSCFTNGHCAEPQGCLFDQGAPGSACGTGDSCALDGGCVTPESGAQCSNGLDDDDDGFIDCADSSCNGSTCDDGNTCTSGTTCNGSTCGGGNTTACNSPPGECFDVTTCANGVGCVYPVRTGPCDGGTCQSDGGCGSPVTTTSPFPYTPSNFDPALAANADAGVNLTCNAVIDTTAADHFPKWCNATPDAVVVALPGGGGDALLVVASSFTLGGNTLTVTGGRPLILAVTGDATLGGVIVVANTDGGVPPGGSGVEPNVAPWCTGTGEGGTGSSGNQTNGGGGGASFGTAGTAGASGGMGAGNGGGGAGTVLAQSFVPLHGGCPGGNGGTANANGGFGGGALQISVAGKLTTTGKIGVPGGGGAHGTTTQATCGGGGGGSGGLLLLEAWSAAFNGGTLLTANGGGGGEGGNTNGNAGHDAEDGHYLDANKANGGAGGTGQGGDGASGATATMAAGNAMAGNGTGCGGAGSGGMGYVFINHYGGTCSQVAGIGSPAVVFNTPCP